MDYYERLREVENATLDSIAEFVRQEAVQAGILIDEVNPSDGPTAAISQAVGKVSCAIYEYGEQGVVVNPSSEDIYGAQVKTTLAIATDPNLNNAEIEALTDITKRYIVTPIGLTDAERERVIKGYDDTGLQDHKQDIWF